MENELNTTLIERTHRGIIFTDIGEKVYGYALNILESRNNILEICKNNALSAHQNLSGNFDIFVIPRFSNNQFFKVFEAVSRNFPKLTLSLKTISWNTFLDVLPIENEFFFLSFIDEDNFNDEKYHQLLDAHELRTEIIKEFPLGVCYKKESKFKDFITSHSLLEIIRNIPIAVYNYAIQEDLFFDKDVGKM